MYCTISCQEKNTFQSTQLKSTPYLYFFLFFFGIGIIYSNNFVEYLILNEIKMMGKLVKIRGENIPLIWSTDYNTCTTF